MIFSWKDELIDNIHAWTRQRGEKMVRYRMISKSCNPFTGRISEYIEEDEMPESFWNVLRIEPGLAYIEIERYFP